MNVIEKKGDDEEMDKKTERKPIIIASNGYMTLMFSEGKVYGDYITKIEFLQKGAMDTVVEIEADEFPVKPMDMEIKKFKEFLEAIMKSE